MSAPPTSGATDRSLAPAVAGRWYPSDPGELGRLVDELLATPAAAFPGSAENVLALIAPHAGYRYSGAVAARGFSAVAGRRFERVIVVGPSHYVGFAGAAVPDAESYRTPLGAVALDVPALDELRARPEFRSDSGVFAREHSVEAELPFLQRALAPGFRLVPVLIGARTGARTAQALADALAPLLGPAVLVIVSSDFTHFGRAFDFVPFADALPERIGTLDRGAIERICAWDAPQFEEYVERTGATICGRHALGVALRLFPRGTRAELAAYDTSGRMTGDWSHSVSYAALVVRPAEASG